MTGPDLAAGHRLMGFVRSARAELLVLRHSPAVWALVLLLPALTLVTRYLTQYVFYRTASTGTVSDLGSPLQLLYTLSPNQMVTVVTASYAGLGSAAAVVLGAVVAGGDWGRGSLKTALAQGPSRMETALGQAAAVITALTASVAINFGVAALVSRLIVTLEAQQATEAILAFPPPEVVLHGVFIGVLISAANGAIGLALGTALRSPAAAIGAALIWYVASQVLLSAVAAALGGPFAHLNQALPNASTTTLANIYGPVIGGPTLEAVPPAINPILAPWVLLTYLVVLIAVFIELTRRRDVS